MWAEVYVILRVEVWATVQVNVWGEQTKKSSLNAAAVEPQDEASTQ